MKKTVIVLALALGFSMSNVNASNALLASELNNAIVKTLEVSPLCKAVATGNLDEVNKLIKAGADVNAKSNGMMPIHYAAKYNRVEIIKVLITAGSKIHRSCDNGYTAIKHAQKSKAKDAEMFLKRFKNKNVWE
ncbi:ankyrin repeat domain-containing protein [Winogradskyella sediminis]|uniref:ankyrin repeat domain-containing protein n=1 Tax=Winogradskyella sediminis TaxID=1382466 RepID=UPI000E251951|nr:ankyrin repeat domain-containing protein [Winogradskyella sediminis]REG90033.1 ankyrin repeat protein [Winogradskyella sediminis]